MSGGRFNPKDHFFHKAKKEGFVARSAYKLEEIQKKFKLLRPKDRVLDLGCAPGAWTQIAAKIIGPQGEILGIDLKVVEIKIPQARFVQGDILETQPKEFSPQEVHCILSDLAPNTTGFATTDQARSYELSLRVLDFVDEVLREGGNAVLKLFMGPDAKKIQDGFKSRFRAVHQFRPEATRKSSTEIYVVGLGKKARN